VAITIADVVTASQTRLIDYWDKKIIEFFQRAHPFGDWLITKGVKQPVKTWKRKLRIRAPNAAMSRAVGTVITPGGYATEAYSEVSRTMRAFTSRIGWMEDDFLIEKGDPTGAGVIETINRRVQDHLTGLIDLLIFGLMGDHSGGNGVQFTIPKPADMGGNDTFAVDAHVPIDPKNYPFAWPGHVVSLYDRVAHTIITGLEKVMIKTKRKNSTDIGGWPYVVTLDTALTGATAIPADGAEVCAQGSYGLGLESMPDLLNTDGAVDFMSQNANTVPQWAPFALDAGRAAIDLVEHIGAVLEELELYKDKEAASDLWLLLPPRQQYKLEAYIENHQTTFAKPFEMKGGWKAMELQIRGRSLKYIVDRWLINADEVYIVDRSDLEFQYWDGGGGGNGKTPIYLKRRGGGSTEGKAFITALTESSVNTYVSDFLGYVSGLLCADRRRHAKITKLEV